MRRFITIAALVLMTTTVVLGDDNPCTQGEIDVIRPREPSWDIIPVWLFKNSIVGECPAWLFPLPWDEMRALWI